MIGAYPDCLGYAKQFTQQDLTYAYHQKIQEGNKSKIVFCIRYDYFKYQVMLSRISNTSAIIQKYINKILSEKLDIFVILYLINI